MENKKIEKTSQNLFENENTASVAEELEFIPAEASETAAESENAPAAEVQKEEETVVEVPEKAEIPEDEEESDTDDESKEEQTSAAYLIKLVAVLTIICTFIALLLAAVNSITADRIAKNIANQKQNAILAIFPEGNTTKEYINDKGETAYIVYRDGEPIGYCVNSIGSGFGGDVEVMVGLEPTGEVYGVKIVRMSETPGIGTKVQGESFLSQFIGQKGSAEADIISGATFSSKAVSEAVDKALAVEIDVYEITENENAAMSQRIQK